MNDCDHPWTSEDGCWICDLEEIIDRQKETISAVTAERDAAEKRLKYFGDCEYQAEPRGAFGMGGGWCAKHERYWNDCRPTPWDVEELRAELSELRARVAEAKEVHQATPVRDASGGWEWCNLCDEKYPCRTVAFLEGDEK